MTDPGVTTSVGGDYTRVLLDEQRSRIDEQRFRIDEQRLRIEQLEQTTSDLVEASNITYRQIKHLDRMVRLLTITSLVLTLNDFWEAFA